MNTDKCTVCGCTELNLIDGFYYCVECNTQNTNVRETIVEQKTLGDGTFALSSKKRIIKLPKKTIEMSGEWYKWHAFNFIINGLADELVAIGAKPTFKTKLLWIWTRYIKKYQNKKEFGLTTEAIEANMTDKPEDEADDVLQMDLEEDEEITEKKSKYMMRTEIVEGSKRDIKFISKGLIMAMLYLALNLDKSEIQLSHLDRYAREKRLNFTKLIRFVPDEINLKAHKLKSLWRAFAQCSLNSPYTVRELSLSLLRKLDLGTPILPDFKKIVNDYFHELCLPNDLKSLVYSLMHFDSCESYDLDDIGKEYLVRLPDYECILMSYILLALKLCFGLDCDYEVRLSDAVDKINMERDLPKSHKFGKYSDPTDRLFSFREWCSYMQFRKIMLCNRCLYMAEQHCLDIDDYVYMEHMADRPQNKRQLTDEISMDLLNKIHIENNIRVIPKEEFVPSSRPMCLYTEIITDHCQDPELKYLISEDFTQYSLKYATENLELIDMNTSENLIKGVRDTKKVINSEVILGNIKKKKSDTNFVYVKNCENKNWMNTNPPTLEHITCENENAEGDDGNEKDSDHGYDSEYTVNEKDVTNATEVETTQEDNTNDIDIQETNTSNEVTVNTDALRESDVQEADEVQKMIKEEDEGKNIFDDSFEYLDVEEEKEPPGEDDAANQANEDPPNEINFDDSESDISCTSFHNFNPSTFDKEKIIKELILHACKKYKISIPTEYKDKKPKKRKIKTDVIETGESSAKRPNKTNKDEAKKQLDDLLNNYKSHIEGDFFGRLQQEVKEAIENANKSENVTIAENNAEQTSDVQNATDTHIDNQSNNDVPDGIEMDDETQKEIDETALFEGEEMVLEDLVPNSDPKFDEKLYDVKQLYIKLKDEPDFVMEDPPELEEIVNRKITEAIGGKLFENNELKIEDSDSDDDKPLSVFKEEKDFVMSRDKHKVIFEDLIKNANIPEFKYWFRHYDTEFMEKSQDWNRKFDEELKANTPASFYFVIKECASVINCTAFHLYKKLQLLEQLIIIKSR